MTRIPFRAVVAAALLTACGGAPLNKGKLRGFCFSADNREQCFQSKTACEDAEGEVREESPWTPVQTSCHMAFRE